jgi:hypothetical protein
MLVKSPGKPRALPVIPEPIVPVPLFYRWLSNSEEAINLRNAKGEEVDRTPVVSDNENDNRY